MIRFILRRDTRWSGYVDKHLQTLDVDCPELEQILTSGGSGSGADAEDFDHTVLIGAEVKKSPV